MLEVKRKNKNQPHTEVIKQQKPNLALLVPQAVAMQIFGRVWLVSWGEKDKQLKYQTKQKKKH